MNLTFNFRMGTSSRDDALNRVKKENVPGPGNYTARVDNTNKAFKFGTQKREGLKVNSTPGPGQYRIPCTIVNIPTYNMGGTFDNKFKYI